MKRRGFYFGDTCNMTDIYILNMCVSLYLMQYVNVMMRRISGCSRVAREKSWEHRATWKLPHFLSLRFYAALSASRRELWEIFPSCFVVPLQCELWDRVSFLLLLWGRLWSGVWPANVNKWRAAGLLVWRVCCDAVMQRLSRLRVAPNTQRKGILFFLLFFLIHNFQSAQQF